ncbi:ancylostoma secreted protein [Diachasma alloeum]|uniref:ancylostoma secreted protein n=1 Tax=Diachasma alloeum TaxID=454923 RepID=UPI0010FB4AA2|nr:ancylostoma secreted protein [Diachasma alloeum]
MLTTFALVLLVSVGAFVNGQADYCDVESCKMKGPHTVCKYPSEEPSEECGQLEQIGVTEEEKKTIVDRHNHWRRYVAAGKETRGNPGPQPAATNMGDLEWDDELAFIAQRWANQCNDVHDACHDTYTEWVGQNLNWGAWSDGYHPNVIRDLVDNWYNEVEHFDANTVSALQPKPPGVKLYHYVQMVWADTKRIGCGITKYTRNKPTQYNPDMWPELFLVCNYGPTGVLQDWPLLYSLTMGKKLSQVVLLCCIAFVVGQEPKFCDLQSCGDNVHTLCAHPSPDPDSSCGELGVVGLTQEEKDALLKAHNDYRAYVASGQEGRGSNGGQPGATNLGPLEWNDEIAEIAQRWANQCNFGHDNCRNTADDYVGQNIASVSWSDQFHYDSITGMVDSWYNEVDNVDRNIVSAYQFSEDTGHYTQLVWAGTTQLGCGLTRYKKPGEWYNTYLVCNYAPGGNIIGAPIYQTS